MKLPGYQKKRDVEFTLFELFFNFSSVLDLTKNGLFKAKIDFFKICD